MTRLLLDVVKMLQLAETRGHQLAKMMAFVKGGETAWEKVSESGGVEGGLFVCRDEEAQDSTPHGL